MRILIIILTPAIALLTGCASMLTIPSEGRFDALPSAPEMRITWRAVDDPTAACKALFPMAMAYHPVIAACAGWDAAKRECTVVTGLVTTHQILGHEVRHCFQGDFHD